MKIDTSHARTEFLGFINGTGTFRSMIILIIAILLAYILSKIIAGVFIRLVQLIAVRADNASDDEKTLQYRRVETFLSVFVAILRALIIAVAAFFVWRLLNPKGNEALATIGAGAIFAVIASGTISSILKDITAGVTMIIEQWFTIGDYVKIEPYSDLSGVVERMTLRSTQIRSISGEIIWLHNQNIQAVRVTPRGVRTLAVDVFVTDPIKAESEIKKIINTIPTGHLMLARKLRINAKDKWSDNLWRLTITGQTTPGREWLVEDYFVDALNGLPKKLMVQKPIVRTADPAAEKRFRRAVRVRNK
jgi:small-conductance mechanosensitive channel